MISVKRVREVLTYNPDTGILMWKVNRGRARIGNHPGTLNSEGYKVVGLDNQRFKAHVLAWVLSHGVWPRMLDHVNENKTDNRLTNLREATPIMNAHNQRAPRSHGTSGYRGVHFYKSRNQFTAQIQVRGVQYRLGYYDTAEQANLAYLSGKIRLTSNLDECTLASAKRSV